MNQKEKKKIKKLKISLVTPKRKNKYDKGIYLNTNVQIQINNIGEVGTTSKSNLGYEQTSFLTGGIEGGYITEISKQAYMFDFYYSYISNSVDNSNTANMWGTFDLGYKMKSEMVPFMGIQYETLKSFNVDSLATSSDSKGIN